MTHHETPLSFARPSPKLSAWGAAISMAILTAGCASADQAPAEEWTTEDEAAYQQCLKDNMAASVAWEMIEQSCRDQVEGKDGPPPLD